MRRKLKLGGLYRHYKGYLMKVLMEVKHSETLEDMVVYVHLDDGQIWARPKQMFLEKIKIEGKVIDRFKLLKVNKK